MVAHVVYFDQHLGAAYSKLGRGGLIFPVGLTKGGYGCSIPSYWRSIKYLLATELSMLNISWLVSPKELKTTRYYLQWINNIEFYFTMDDCIT